MFPFLRLYLNVSFFKVETLRKRKRVLNENQQQRKSSLIRFFCVGERQILKYEQHTY